MILVRVNFGGSEVTLACVARQQDPLLPDHLILNGVEGVSDGDFPDLKIGEVSINKRDIVYMCFGRQIAAKTAANQSSSESAVPKTHSSESLDSESVSQTKQEDTPPKRRRRRRSLPPK